MRSNSFYLATLLWLLYVVICLGAAFAYGSTPSFPHIESQRTTTAGARRLTISNPLRKPLWLYIECEHILTVTPIGVDGRPRVVVEMLDPEGPIDTECFLHSWIVQGAESPEPWNP